MGCVVEGELAIPDELRHQIRSARNAAGLSQDALGKKVGVTQSAIAQIENGQALRSQYLLRICRVLRLTPPAILEDRILERWMDLGRRALRRSPDFMVATADMVARLVGSVDDAGTVDAENSDDGDEKTSKPS